MQKIFLTVKLRKDFGAAGELEIEARADSPTPQETSLVDFDQLVNQVEKMFAHFMDTHATQMRINDLTENKTTVQALATGISVIMKDGKRMYRVKAGEWSEHGVPFYPEHMKACGIDPRSVSDDGYTFKKEVKAVIELSNGRPKRVLDLIPIG